MNNLVQIYHRVRCGAAVMKVDPTVAGKARMHTADVLPISFPCGFQLCFRLYNSYVQVAAWSTLYCKIQWITNERLQNRLNFHRSEIFQNVRQCIQRSHKAKVIPMYFNVVWLPLEKSLEMLLLTFVYSLILKGISVSVKEKENLQSMKRFSLNYIVFLYFRVICERDKR